MALITSFFLISVLRKILNINKMETGPALFRKNVPFMMHVEGTINGSPFTVEGKGASNSQGGHHKGKWVCTSGTLPMSWAALSTTLGYGFK